MITSGRRNWNLRWIAAAAAITVAAAACSPSSAVTKGESKTPESSAPTSTPTSAPAPSTSVPVPVDGSTPVTAPDPTGLPSVADPDPAIVIGELDNGLRYLIRDNDNPGGRVEMRLAIDAGSVLEDDTQDGGAHFLEHMLFNGTEEFPENELIDVLRGFGAGFGADINAYTSYDETVYQLTMPTADDSVVDTGLDVLEQWLTAATIDQAQVEAERGVVLDEWRGSESSSDGRIFDTLESLFLTGTAYEDKDPIGTDTAISEMDADPLRRYYDDWYRPEIASVIVVGDIDPDEIEDGIVERFSGVDARGSSSDRPVFTVEPASDAQIIVLSDPDVAEGFAQVTLPLSVSATEPDTPEAQMQESILDALAFDMIATRLGNDALRGDAPFDDAWVDSSSFVRDLDAPEILVSADGDALEASTQAVYDEYERVRRFGFSQAEVDRAVSSMRTSIESSYEGRDSRQDASYADEYVRHVLEGESIPTADAEFDLVNVILDRASPETIAYMFVERLAAAAPHMMVVVPESEVGDLPDESVFLAQAGSMRDRELEPRSDDAGIDGDLMAPPEPVEEVSREALTEFGSPGFIDPVILEFENGVTVALNVTNIVDGQVDFEARSPGGLSVLADADVPAADAAGTVVGQSGFATYDAIALDAFLADKDVSLQAGIDIFTESLYGGAATSDLEVLFQLIHLGMTQPRVDPIALDQYLDDEMPYAADPSIDPGYMEYVALLDARYDDPRYLLPTVDSLNSVTAEDIERITRDRYGDASDFAFAFSGDFDIDEMVELSRRYLGTLPSTGRVEAVDYIEPAAPAGVVEDQVNAGQGEQASVAFLFTGPATVDRRDDVAALIVQEVLTARLTDTVREELGDSYSPYAAMQLTAGGSPNVETYISNTTGVDLVDEVVEAVLTQLEDLRTNGPTPTEYDAATEVVRQQLDLFSNGQVNSEVLAVLTDPAGNASFDDFLQESFSVADIDIEMLRADIERWLPATQYIEIRVLPR
ncbi:MAG: insulinase family protein [Ilumatobacteraceae bacterium]